MEDVVKGIGGEYVGNYTGPYWSNGKVQSSVEWGDETPQNALDALSRQHDSAYKRFPDEAHRMAADKIYNEEAQKLKQKFPSLAGNLVLYGNYAQRSASKTASNAANGFKLFGLPGLLGGLIYTAAGNMVTANKMLDGKYLNTELKDVRDYYSTDPLKKNFEGIGRPKGFNEPTKGSIDVSKVALPKGGPTIKDVKNAELIVKQAKKLENYSNLEKQAQKSTENEIPVRLPLLGYRPKHLQDAFRKKKKNKNKIHIAPVRKI